MEKIILLTVLLFVFSFQLFSQEKSDCPAIKIISPDKLAKVDGIMIFTISSEQINNKDFEYKWIISAGKIVLGQGTTGIAVEINSDLQGMTITASVKIKGLAEGCKNEFSGSGEVEVIPQRSAHPINKYGRLNWNDERKWLDSLFIELGNDPTAMAYIIFSIEKDSEKKLVLDRQNKILRFMKIYKILPCRIVFKMEKTRIYQTYHWIIPQGVTLPQ